MTHPVAWKRPQNDTNKYLLKFIRYRRLTGAYSKSTSYPPGNKKPKIKKKTTSLPIFLSPPHYGGYIYAYTHILLPFALLHALSDLLPVGGEGEPLHLTNRCYLTY